jgi:hypothetical protein
MSRSVDPNHDPALTFFLLLRMVTPIDHFLLILSRPHRIDARDVAKAQQIMPHGRHMPMPRRRIIFFYFNWLTGVSDCWSSFPWGSFSHGFVKTGAPADWSTLLSRSDRNTRKYAVRYLGGLAFNVLSGGGGMRGNGGVVGRVFVDRHRAARKRACATKAPESSSSNCRSCLGSRPCRLRRQATRSSIKRGGRPLLGCRSNSV